MTQVSEHTQAECPTCGAGRGQPCVTRDGVVAPNVHYWRPALSEHQQAPDVPHRAPDDWPLPPPPAWVDQHADAGCPQDQTPWTRRQICRCGTCLWDPVARVYWPTTTDREDPTP